MGFSDLGFLLLTVRSIRDSIEGSEVLTYGRWRMFFETQNGELHVLDQMNAIQCHPDALGMTSCTPSLKWRSMLTI